MSQDWEVAEQVVTMIERHLSPNAKVKRNQHLPVLGSASKRTRQCDVVVTSGIAPRQTISIVEVQKRQSRPSINEFNGWVEKMREVGAQHLICVSQMGFPSSIEEKADQHGPTIRLVTLQQLAQENWPLESVCCSPELEVVRYERLLGIHMEGHHLFRMDPKNPNPNEAPDPHAKIFQLTDGRLLSATDLVDWHLFSNPKNISELPKGQLFNLGVRFQWNWDEALRVQDFGETWVPIKNLLIQIRLHIRKVPLEWNMSAYEQRGWGDAAWMLRGRAKLGKDTFDVVVPMTRSSPGSYLMGHPTVLGNLDAFFALGDSGIKAHRFSDEQQVS